MCLYQALCGSMTQGALGTYLNVSLLQTTSQGQSDEKLLTLCCFNELLKCYLHDLVTVLSECTSGFKGPAYIKSLWIVLFFL